MASWDSDASNPATAYAPTLAARHLNRQTKQVNKTAHWTNFKIECCTALLLLASLTGFSQDNDEIIVGGKVFNTAKIHVYPNSIPEFRVEFPDREQEITKVETIGTLKEENFIVTTWLQTKTDGLHYALIHHKIPPIIENEIKNRLLSI